MTVASPTFFVLLRNYNPINELVAPQLRDAYQNYGNDVLNLFKEHYKAKSSNTPVEALGAFFARLDGRLKNINDVGIVQGWREYFNSQPQTIKSETYKRLPNPAFLGKTFPKGKVASMGNIMSGPVVPPVNTPGIKSPTNLIDPGVDLPSYVFNNINQAATIAGKLLNKNISSILTDLKDSTTAHGGNLIPDIKHAERMGKVVTKVLKEVVNTAGDASGFLLKTLKYNPFGVKNNDISAPPIALEQTMEGQKVILNSVGLDMVKRDTKPLKSLASPKPENLV
jgi:hypothetical protein